MSQLKFLLQKITEKATNSGLNSRIVFICVFKYHLLRSLEEKIKMPGDRQLLRLA